MQQRIDSLLHPPIGFAHRGARAHAPENTLEAFRLAVRLGATGLESDVWLTADGIPVLDHDGVVRIGRRKRAVSGVRRDELPAHVPSLSDLLNDVPGDWHLSLDLKDAASGAAVIDVVGQLRPDLLGRLWLCHPDVTALLTMRSPELPVRLVNSTRLTRMKEGPERRAATLSAEGIHGVNLHHTDWSGGLTTLFHRFGVLTLAWDLQFDEPLRKLLRMGIDAVFSDWVDRMTTAFAAEIDTATG